MTDTNPSDEITPPLPPQPDARPAPEGNDAAAERPRAEGPAGWPGAVLSSATPPPPPQEVEAVPISKRETRGPAIEVGAERRAPAGTMASESDPTGPPPPPIGAQTATAQAHTTTRAWSVLMHLAYLIPLNIPGLVVTALIWIYSRGDDPFSDDQGKEAINFQVFYACVGFVLAATCFLSPLYFVLWLVGAVLAIVAAVNVGDGKRYRYPFIFRLIR